MRCTLHALTVVLLGLTVLGLWAVGSTHLAIPGACLDTLLALGLLARTESY
jgi:hypothetical protein